MKVALLFRGQPRFLKNNISFLSHKKNIFDVYDTDVYCHVWWSKNKKINCSTWSNISSINYQEDDLEYIKNNYKPKILESEEPKIFFLPSNEEKILYNKHFKNIEQINNIQNCLSQMYSTEKVSKLISDKAIESYDYIIFSRLDNVLLEIPDLRILDKNFFYLSNLHPRFPDNLYIFSPKFFPFLNVYSDFFKLALEADFLTAESIFEASYKKYFNINSIKQINNIKTYYVRKL